MAEPFEPTPAEVKALIPRRLLGEPFGEDTEPTLIEVESIIHDITEGVVAFVGVEIPADYYDLAKAVIKRGAAAEVEQGFWPEQHDETDRATYNRLIARYMEMRELLKQRIVGATDGGLGTIELIGPTRAAAEARPVVDPWR